MQKASEALGIPYYLLRYHVFALVRLDEDLRLTEDAMERWFQARLSHSKVPGATPHDPDGLPPVRHRVVTTDGEIDGKEPTNGPHEASVQERANDK